MRYLSGVPFDKFDFPVNLPERSYASQSESMQEALYSGLTVPAAAFAGLMLAAYFGTKNLHDDEEG